MKYTMSKDGKERATLRLPIRVTKDELIEGNKLAKVNGYDGLRPWLLERLMIQLGYMDEILSGGEDDI